MSRSGEEDPIVENEMDVLEGVPGTPDETPIVSSAGAKRARLSNDDTGEVADEVRPN